MTTPTIKEIKKMVEKLPNHEQMFEGERTFWDSDHRESLLYGDRLCVIGPVLKDELTPYDIFLVLIQYIEQLESYLEKVDGQTDVRLCNLEGQTHDH